MKHRQLVWWRPIWQLSVAAHLVDQVVGCAMAACTVAPPVALTCGGGVAWEDIKVNQD